MNQSRAQAQALTGKIQSFFGTQTGPEGAAKTLRRQMATGDRLVVSYNQVSVEADLHAGTSYGANCQSVCDHMVAQERVDGNLSQYVAQVFLSKGIAYGRFAAANMEEVYRSYTDPTSKTAGKPFVRVSAMIKALSALSALSDLAIEDSLEKAARSAALDLDEKLSRFARLGQREYSVVEVDGRAVTGTLADAEFLAAWIAAASPTGVVG